jgi:hypothetical protein
MLKSDKPEFERGTAAKSEGEDRKNGKRIATMVVTVRPARRNRQPYQPCGDFEQGQEPDVQIAHKP